MWGWEQRMQLQWPLRYTGTGVDWLWKTSCYPCNKFPLFTSLKESNGKAKADTHGFSNVAGVARTRLSTATGSLRDSSSWFSAKVYSLSLCLKRYYLQGSRCLDWFVVEHVHAPVGPVLPRSSQFSLVPQGTQYPWCATRESWLIGMYSH
jgi:hypothetical protein